MAQERIGSAMSSGVLIRGFTPRDTIWQQVVRFARRKPLGALGAVVALILIVVAIFAPFIGVCLEYVSEPVTVQVSVV